VDFNLQVSREVDPSPFLTQFSQAPQLQKRELTMSLRALEACPLPPPPAPHHSTHYPTHGHART